MNRKTTFEGHAHCECRGVSDPAGVRGLRRTRELSTGIQLDERDSYPQAYAQAMHRRSAWRVRQLSGSGTLRRDALTRLAPLCAIDRDTRCARHTAHQGQMRGLACVVQPRDLDVIDQQRGPLTVDELRQLRTLRHLCGRNGQVRLQHLRRNSLPSMRAGRRHQGRSQQDQDSL